MVSELNILKKNGKIFVMKKLSQNQALELVFNTLKKNGASKENALPLAIGIIDGASRAAEVAIAGLLSELKIINNEKIKKIKKIPIKNSANQIIGSMKWIC